MAPKRYSQKGTHFAESGTLKRFARIGPSKSIASRDGFSFPLLSLRRPAAVPAFGNSHWLLARKQQRRERRSNAKALMSLKQHARRHAPLRSHGRMHERPFVLKIGNGKRGHCERGLSTGGISRISKISRISRKCSDPPSFSTVLGFSGISRISKFSRISRKWTFLKRPLFQKTPFSEPEKTSSEFGGMHSGSGRLIFIHLQCWEVLPFGRFQRQRCTKILCPKDPVFYTPLALKTAKGQHLPALEVYKNQSPREVL